MPVGFSIGLIGVASGWNPSKASIPLYAWFRADLGITIDSGVSIWKNQGNSGDSNRNQVQPTVGFQPILNSSDPAYGGKATLNCSGHYFNGAGNWTVSIVSPLTFIFIGEAAATTSIISVDSGAAPYNLLWSRGASGVEFFGNSGAITLDSVDLVTSPSAVMLKSTVASGSELYVNNFTTPSITNAGMAWDTCSNISIAGASAGVAELTGKIAEVIIYSGIPSNTDMINIKKYLNVTRAYGLNII